MLIESFSSTTPSLSTCQNSSISQRETEVIQKVKSVIKFDNGDTYEGYTTDGYREGLGTLTCSNGMIYDGNWRKDLFYGQGKLTHHNFVYEGKWLKGLSYGHGTCCFYNGDTYEGGWRMNVPHGEGTMTYKDYGQYKGDWLKGKRHGYGKMVFLNGDSYEGDWKKDFFEGEGSYTYKNGDQCHGVWLKGKKHGLFVCIIDDQKKDGIWLNDRYMGYQAYLLPKGWAFEIVSLVSYPDDY